MFKPNHNFTACVCGASPTDHWKESPNKLCARPGVCPNEPRTARDIFTAIIFSTSAALRGVADRIESVASQKEKQG